MKQSTKLKIGLVLDDSLDRNDGVQQYVRSLGTWLDSQGHTVHYLAGQNQADDETTHSLSRNIGVRFNGNRLTIPLPANVSAIKALLAKEKFDVLHVQMPYSPLMAGKIIANASTDTAVVGTFHILPLGGLQRHGSKALGLVQKRQLKRLDAICSVSGPAAEFARSHFGIVSSVIPNMVDLKRFKTPLQPHPGRIVFLGRLVPRKGCLQLLKALHHGGIDHSEVLIAGDGPQRAKLEKYVAQNDMKNVVFLGRIPEEHKPSLLASAEIAVFPSLGGESFGIVLIEAMAAGAGVVLGGNNPGYTSVLANVPGTLFDPSKTTAFAALLTHFLDDKRLRDKTHSIQQTAVKQYDIQTVGQQILQMYKTALLHRSRDVR